MENLHLKNLNNTDHVENYLKQLEKYEKKIENLSTKKLMLFSEMTENKEHNNNLINSISKKEEQIKGLKEKQKTLTSVLLNYFLNELEKLEHKNYKNIQIIRKYLNDLKNNRETYVNIMELRYINNNINNMNKY